VAHAAAEIEDKICIAKLRVPKELGVFCTGMKKREQQNRGIAPPPSGGEKYRSFDGCF
jgi:hypothetical protein